MYRFTLPWTRPRPRGRLHVMSYYRNPSAPIAGARARADGRDRPDGLPLAGRSHARPVACEAPRKKPPQDEEEEGGGEGQAADRARLGRRWAPPRPSHHSLSRSASFPPPLLMRGCDLAAPPVPGDDGTSSPGAVPADGADVQPPAGDATARGPCRRPGGRDRPARLPPSGRSRVKASRVKAPRLEMRRASNHCMKKMKKWAVEKSKRQAAARETVGSNSGLRRDPTTASTGRRRPSPPLFD